MPTYDYRGHAFEHFQSIRDPSLRKCPKCGKPKLERLIGAGAGVLFKGGGFYQTDYRSESYKRGESSESGTKPAEAAPAAASDKKDAKAEPSSAKPPAPKPDAAPAKPAKKKRD
jgi:putative FmdB family regulatory protein